MNVDVGLVSQAARPRKRNTTGARALAVTLLDDLAMNAHLLAIVTRLEGDIHALNPPWKIREILSRKVVRSHRRVLHSTLETEGELLLWYMVAEMLQAREGILVILRFREGEIDVEGPGRQVGEVARMGVSVGSIFEVEELVHLVYGGHAEGVGGRRRGSYAGLLRWIKGKA